MCTVCFLQCIITHVQCTCTIYILCKGFTDFIFKRLTFYFWVTAKWLSLVIFDRQIYQWWRINVTQWHNVTCGHSHVACQRSQEDNHMSRVRGHRRTITCRMSEVTRGQSLDNESRKMSIGFCRAVWVSHAVEQRMKGVSKGALSVSWLWSSVELSV